MFKEIESAEGYMKKRRSLHGVVQAKEEAVNILEDTVEIAENAVNTAKAFSENNVEIKETIENTERRETAKAAEDARIEGIMKDKREVALQEKIQKENERIAEIKQKKVARDLAAATAAAASAASAASVPVPPASGSAASASAASVPPASTGTSVLDFGSLGSDVFDGGRRRSHKRVHRSRKRSHKRSHKRVHRSRRAYRRTRR
jgi:hypothetical protein